MLAPWFSVVEHRFAAPFEQPSGGDREPSQDVCWERNHVRTAVLYAIDSATHMQAKRGGLKDTLPDDMLHAVFTATLERTGLNPAVGWPIRP